MTPRTPRTRTYWPASGTMTGAMDTPRWNDAQLDAMRQIQDPVADPVVAALFAAGKVDAVNSLMRTLVENDGLPPGALPSTVVDYLAATSSLPDWADPAKIAAAARVWANLVAQCPGVLDKNAPLHTCADFQALIPGFK